MTRYYNQWSGNPKGHPENTENCDVEVWQGMHSYQCSRKWTHDGLCLQHFNMREQGRRLSIPENTVKS